MTLPIKEARRVAHEAVCWVLYEIETGGFTKTGDYRAVTLWFATHNTKLRGLCWLTSYIITRVLRARGVAAGIATFKGSHGFVLTACGLVIDATIMQFGGVGPRVRRWTKTERAAVGVSLHCLDKHTRECGWEAWNRSLSLPANQMDTIRRICARMGVVIE